MRAALALLAVAGSLLLAGLFADTATADAPTLDVHTSGKSAIAYYRLTPNTYLFVAAGEFVPQTGEQKRYFAFVDIVQEPCPDCLGASQPVLHASADFDRPQLHGGVNGAKLDVTLPVVFCGLNSCPTSIEVSLVWEPDGQPIHNTNSTRTDTESCQFTKVTRLAYTDATATGYVSDGTTNLTNLATGERSGSVLEQSTRIVGFGYPWVCL